MIKVILSCSDINCFDPTDTEYTVREGEDLTLLSNRLQNECGWLIETDGQYCPSCAGGHRGFRDSPEMAEAREQMDATIREIKGLWDQIRGRT